MSRLNRAGRGHRKVRARRVGGRKRPTIEALETRQLLTSAPGVTASINSITINLSTPGPTSISGSLNPGDEIAAYRIDGSAGEQLQFTSVSTSSTNGNWLLYNENSQEVAGASLGTNFTANLTSAGSYYLELYGNITTPISYSFQVADSSSYPTPAPAGLDTPETGSLASGKSATFTFTAPGGLPLYLESLGSNPSMYAQLQAPGGSYVFQNYINSNGNGPYLLPASGSYTLTVTDESSAASYDFEMLSLPSVATSLATGPTQTISGALGTSEGVAVYSFLGAQGERLAINNEVSSTGPGYLYLIKPDGTESSNFGYTDGGSAPLSLTENGTYYLMVVGTGSSSLGYQFRLTDTAYSPLNFSQATTGDLATPTQADVYTFTGTAGQSIYINELSSSEGYYGTLLALYGPNNQYATEAWIGGGLSYTLPASGTYTLEASDNEGYSSESYSFEAYQNVDPTTSLTLGQEVTGTLANPGDEASYTFTGTAGQRVYFDDHVATTGLYATLTAPYGTQVFNFGLSNGDGPYYLPQSGTYTLTISAEGGNSTGAYDFILDDAAQATTISLTAGSGTTETGTLATGFATNLYQFSGTAGQLVEFRGLLDSYSDGTVAWLYAPGASGSNPYTTYQYLDNSGQWTLPVTGTYLIAVRGQGDTTASINYSFELYDNTVPTTGLTLGQEVTGTLTNPGDEHAYTFTGSVGEQVYFDPRDATSGIYAELYYPNSTSSDVFNAYFGYNEDYGPYTLNQPGTYTLVISGEGGTSTGAFDFSLDNVAQATAITLTSGSGTTVSGSLATGLTTNLYTFTLTSGQEIYFQGLQDSTPDATRVYLYTPSNSYYTWDYAEGTDQWNLTGAGTYTVAVEGYNASATPPLTYKFDLYDDIDPTTGLTLGHEVTGTLTNPGDEASYTFTGTGGQRVYFDSLDTTSNVAAKLIDPDGGSVFNDYLSYGDEGPFFLTQAGTYTLTIYANYGATGAYDFRLDDASQATAMTTGTVVNGTLTTGYATNLYQFSGTAGQRIDFDGLLDSVSDGALAYLYGPTSSGINSELTDFYLENQDAYTLPSTGTYLLAVNGQGRTTGAVTYQFEAYNNVDPTTSYTLGQEETGTLVNPGDEASFTFTGSVGQQVYFDPRDQTSGIYAELYYPNSTSSDVFDAYFGYNEDYGPYLLNEAGTYTLTIYGSGLSTGAYDFSLDDPSQATPITLATGGGTTVSGSIATGLTTNLYTFTGTAGERVYYEGSPLSPSVSVYTYLYGPNLAGGNGTTIAEITGLNAAGDAQWTLPYTGAYTVAVVGLSPSTTTAISYQFELFDNVDPSTTLGLNQEMTGTLTNPGDESSYTFTATAGEQVYFDPRIGTSGLYATLYYPNSTSSYVFNAYFGYNEDYGPHILDQAGTYTLTIYGSGTSTGAYDFSLDNLAHATPLTVSPGSETPVSGSLGTGLTTNLYSFSGTAGERIYFQGQQDSTQDAALVYLYYPIYAENQTGYTDVYADAGSNQQWTLPGTGTYLVAVTGVNSTVTGPVSYGFNLFGNVDPSTPLTLGTPVSSSLSNPGDEVTYTFTGTPGQRIFYDGQSAASGIDALLENPSGGQVFNIVAASDAGIDTLTEPGTYTLTFSGGTGAYAFNLLDASSQSLTPSSTAANVSGTLSPGNSTAIYQFAGTAGETVVLSNGSFAPSSGNWYLVDPSDNIVGGNNGFGTSSFTRTLPLTGPYELVLQGTATSSVSYSFTIQATPPATVAPTGFGTPDSGTLAGSASTSYTFNATAGLPVFLDTITNSNGDLYAQLIDPSSNTVFSNYVTSISGAYILPTSGTYTLKLTNETSSSNSYSVELVNLQSAATALTLGALTSGTLNAGAPIVAPYSFTGTAGQDLFLNNQSTSGITFELYDPYGDRLVNVSSGSAGNPSYDGGPLTLTTSGTYYLLAVGSATTSIGYQFRLTDTSTVPLSFDTSISRTITNAHQDDVVTFTGTAGEQIYIHELSSSNGYYGTYWYLDGPNNQDLTTGWLGGDLSYTLPVAGTYTLVGYDEEGYTSGNYSFEVYQNVDPTTGLTLGHEVTGTLANPGDEASYTFTGTAGQRVYFDSHVATTGLDATLTTPYDNAVFSGDALTSGGQGPYYLPQSGTYTLTLYGSGSYTGAYDFILDDAAQATTISLTAGSGTTETGTLATGYATNLYQFTGTAGETVFFQGLLDSPGSAAYAYLYAPGDSGFSSYIDGSYPDLGNSGQWTLPVTGTYLIAVRGRGTATGTVSYQFELYDNTDPTTGLALGHEVTGTVVDPGDAFTYTFTGSVGQRVYLDPHVGTGELYAQLTDPYGTSVFNDYLPSGGRGPYTLTEAGTYTLTISDQGSTATGAFDFILDDAVAQATTISLTSGSGTIVSGTLPTGLATNLYQFTGTAGESIFYKGLSDNPADDAVAWFYTPTATGSNPYSAGDIYAESYTQWTLPVTGTYLLAIRGQGNTTGTVGYQFELYDNANPTTNLTLGQEVTGTIANPGDEATYTFTGSLGQKVYFDPRDQTSGIDAQLTGPYGTSIFNSALSSNDQGPYTLPYSGTYTLTIYPTGNNTGAFDFSLDDVAQATALTLTPGAGTTVSGSLATGLTTNLYTFTATAGQDVFFQGVTDSPGGSAYAIIYGPDNSSAFGEYPEYSALWTVPYTGSYTIAVQGRNASTTGAVGYLFNLFDNTDPSSGLTLGQEVTGTVLNPGDQFTYTFTGSPGQRVYFDPRDTTSGIYAQLTAPDGGSVFNDAFSSGDPYPYTLTEAGTYTLTIYGYGNGGYTGAFDFSLDDVAQATALATGTPISGTLSGPLTTNLYQFTGTAGESVYFEGISDSPADAADVYFFNPINGYVDDFYSEQTGLFTLPEAGTYLVAVRGDGRASGSVTYEFDVFANVNPTTSYTLGQEVTGTLVNPGDKANFTFTGTPGEQVYFDSRDQTSGIYATLYDPNSTSSTVFSSAYFPDNDYGPYTLNQAGTYTLTIYGSGLSTGAYDFSLDNVAQATPINLTPGSGTAVSGTLATGLTTNLYSFSGTAGQRIYFQGQQDSTQDTALVYLYYPSYAQNGAYTYVYAENSTQWTLPGTGTYLLAVTGVKSSVTGPDNYAFTLVDNADPTTPLTLNSEVTGSLTNPGDEASFTFTGYVGQQVIFSGLETGSSQYATLYDPDGNSVFGSYLDSRTSPYTLTTPGTYTLVLTTNGANTGNYDFRLLDLASQTKLQVGTTEADLTVTLSAPATQQVLIQYATADGTATAADGQYKPATGLLLFQPGQTTATVEVEAIDMFTTQTTSFDVNLSSPVGGVTIAQGGGTGVVTINANAGATINGEVYQDTNGDGSLGGGEPGLANWTVNLLNASNNIVDTAYTDANGDYSFTGVTPGTYTVEEVVKTGWDQTAPTPVPPGTYTETVSAGQTINNVNFGDFQAVTIGGEVYNDDNGDGSLDGGDSGLANWTVELVNSSNQVVSVQTGSGGSYQFTNVGPGTYTVEEVLQSGYIQTSTPATYSEHPSSGTNINGLNFGDFKLGTVGGEVYGDTNGNGVLNTGEPGLSGWTVYLVGSSAQVTGTVYPSYSDTGSGVTFSGSPLGTLSTSTIQFGTQTAFQWHPFGASSFGVDFTGFIDVPSTGSYTFEVDSDDGSYLFIDGALAVSDGGQHNPTVQSGTVSLGAGIHSFELQFFENGVGTSGVDLDLPSGVAFAQATITNAAGVYSFSGIGPGSDTLQVVQQSGYTPTSPTSIPITGTSGLDSTGNNFGEFASSTLGGEVFNDLNADGVLDDGEAGIAGVTVNLLSGSSVIATTTTVGNGDYSFTVSQPGTYTIEEVLPNGDVLTAPAAGSYTETIASGQSVSGLNFGDFQTVSIGGEVFNDLNGDGALEGGEPGLVGWTVELVNSSNQVVSTQTVTGGAYSFTGITPGTYTVEVTTPTGYVLTDPAAKTYSVTPTSGQNVSGLNFGEFQEVTLGGEVFNDLNGNGTLDNGEPGLANWTVELIDNTTHTTLTTSSATGGGYSFGDVGPGNYTLEVVVQTGYATSTAASYNVNTTSGLNVASFNFGEFNVATFTGQVYNDLNGDGSFDAGDSGIAGWTIDLYRVDTGFEESATTNASGDYSFNNLGPGTYYVEDSLPTGDIQTTTPTYYTVTPTDGQVVNGLNFGIFQEVRISGEVFSDTNGDGTLQNGEPGLSGWTVELINNATQATLTTTTDTNGDYEFTGVGPGTYTVEDVVNPGYDPTGPASGRYTETTASGQDIPNLDFGNFQAVSVGGEVYGDTNGDGTLDDGESGLANWTVELINTATNATQTTTTGTGGSYAFSQVGPGTYTLEVVAQSGYTATTPTTLQITLTSGSSLTAEDFGEFQIPTVSGEVYDDLNGNGNLDSGESGLANWTVELVNSSDAVVATATTDSGGNYVLPVNQPGHYTVQEVVKPGYLLTQPASTTYSVSAVGGQNVLNDNFGNFQLVTLGGQVYNDLNGDGAPESGEPGLQGWTVELINNATAAITTTTTDAQGNYSFADVGPGGYTVEEMTQGGFVQTSTPTTYLEVTRSGQDLSNLDFGNYLAATFSGEVYNDLNGNAMLDNGEPGLANWTVELVNAANSVTASMPTDSQGDYQFTNVGPGAYKIELIQKSGYSPTTPTTIDVTATSGLVSTGNDFGEFQGPTLSGQVFDDLNGDGVQQSGETGLQGWTVDLLGSSSQLITTATTDIDGDYAFPGLPPGTYTVEVVGKTGFQTTAPASGTYTETITSGQSVADLNFGEFQQVTFSGEVFNDLNGDGALQSGEPGLAGWTVNLIQDGGTIATMNTVAGGYSFANLGPGSYTIQVETQSGYTSTTPTSLNVNAISGDNLTAEDFGQFQNVSIAGEVFNDSNGDGMLDNGETGLQGWTVDLLEGGSKIQSKTTDAGGDYTFTNVGPGSYSIQIEPKTGYTTTTTSPLYVTTSSGDNLTAEDFGEFQGPTLSGQVFDDLNGDGSQETGDLGLQGWTVELLGSSDQLINTAITDVNGDYAFPNLPPGTYTVEVVGKSGYQTTAPASGTYTETLASGQSIANLSFGEFQKIAISGEVFNDLNDAGTLEAGDPGLAGWTVNLIQDGGTIATMNTVAGGTYSFANLGPGSYTIQVETPTGYTATTPTSLNVNATSGDNISGEDFGQFQDVTLGGEVYNDLNGDGALESGEPGLQGWLVALVQGGRTITTTNTGAGGGYSFSDVGPGSYTIQVEPETGYTNTTPISLVVTTTSGQGLAAEDFGEFQGVSIGGEVFNDLNGTGTFAIGDPGLAGWTIDLIQDGSTVQSKTTGAGGVYAFTGIGPGSYTIQIEAMPGYIATTSTSLSVTATSGDNVNGEDFGQFQEVSIGGEVFNDLNGNGALDTGEPGLAGWTVDLINSANQTTAVTTMTPGGTYSFGDVGPGTYTVSVTPPAGYVATTPTSIPVTTSSGSNASGLDFGEFQQVTIGGEVYQDTNGNGLLDDGEAGIQGWTVELINNTTKAVSTQFTDSSGDYSFTGVGPGSYTVEAVPQSSYLQTSSPTVYTLTTTSGHDDANLDFGEFLTASILGQVYNDVNGNGVQNAGDTGLAGWTIDLINNATQATLTTTTNSLGNYSFGGVAPGSYTIEEQTQTGYTPTTPTTIAVSATYGLASVGNNFGEFKDVSIGGEVYNDLNGDAALESGEPGLAGWTVDLTNNATHAVLTANSVAGGTYSFGDVGPGTYTVSVTPPSGYVATTSTSLPVTTSGGTNVSGLNFGEFQEVTLGGEVYNDLNADGSLDNGEPGFANWTVNLLNGQGQVIQTTTTATGGTYSFSDVGPGAHTIQEVPQSSGGVPYVPTSPSSGTITLTPTSGTNVASLNFGNILQPQVVNVLVDYGTNPNSPRQMSLIGLNRDLPFVNITAIEVVFNENVSVTKAELALTSQIGSGVAYNFTSFSYNATTFDAKWTLPTAIGVDSLMLALDGHHASTGTDGVHVGSGIYLGDYSLGFSVLPGDVNGDLAVNAGDLTLVEGGILKPASATVWEDVDGSGTVDFTDYADVQKWVGKKLP